jgi:hypothetical protein
MSGKCIYVSMKFKNRVRVKGNRLCKIIRVNINDEYLPYSQGKGRG